MKTELPSLELRKVIPNFVILGFINLDFEPKLFLIVHAMLFQQNNWQNQKKYLSIATNGTLLHFFEKAETFLKLDFTPALVLLAVGMTLPQLCPVAFPYMQYVSLS